MKFSTYRQYADASKFEYLGEFKAKIENTSWGLISSSGFFKFQSSVL